MSDAETGRKPMTYMALVEECRAQVEELFPWDLAEEMEAGRELMVVDIREPYEFEALHIAGSLNVPRGVLEPACDWGYEETVPALAAAREKEIVLICRSGYRSIFAACTLQRMGYRHVRSLKTGLRGWNDYEQSMVSGKGEPLTLDDSDAYFAKGPTKEQLGPKG